MCMNMYHRYNRTNKYLILSKGLLDECQTLCRTSCRGPFMKNWVCSDLYVRMYRVINAVYDKLQLLICKTNLDLHRIRCKYASDFI